MQHSYHLPGIRCSADVINLKLNQDEVYLITRIEVGEESRNRGVGGKLLQLVCDAADYEGVILMLQVAPDGSYLSLSVDQLMDWYEQYGFESLEDYSEETMVRFPVKNGEIDRSSIPLI